MWLHPSDIVLQLPGGNYSAADCGKVYTAAASENLPAPEPIWQEISKVWFCWDAGEGKGPYPRLLLLPVKGSRAPLPCPVSPPPPSPSSCAVGPPHSSPTTHPNPHELMWCHSGR